MTLIQTVYKKNIHLIETINILLQRMKIFLGAAQGKKMKKNIEGTQQTIMMKMYHSTKTMLI